MEGWLSRRFGDTSPRHFGTGWISGTLGVFLAACGLGGVLVLHFPEWLTSAELRANYPVPLMRALIGAAIGLGFLCGCLSLLLRSRKVLGLTAIALAGLAALSGGSAVPIDNGVAQPFYVGLDWFLLNLLLLALVFVPLEQTFGRLPEQGVFRFGWVTDGGHFLVSHLALQVLTFLSLLPAGWLAARLVAPDLQAWVASQPIWLQVPAIMLIADLTQYWVHRAFHRVSWLWPFHAVHHSSRVLDWLAGSRLHLVDVVVTRALVLVPVFLLGFAEPALYAWLVIIAFHAVFNHVNLRFRFRWIEGVLVTPRFHHWHHAVAPVDRNFAVHFPWIDRLFGTHYMPGDAWPAALGIEGHPVPEGYLAQTGYPFRALRDRQTGSSVAAVSTHGHEPGPHERP
ncbi:MAG: sterol desaturase family protein [Pseudomonadales bacterium]|nr:sterol desaturase family protein [Pseudomonadales bacterium]